MSKKPRLIGLPKSWLPPKGYYKNKTARDIYGAEFLAALGYAGGFLDEMVEQIDQTKKGTHTVSQRTKHDQTKAIVVNNTLFIEAYAVAEGIEIRVFGQCVALVDTPEEACEWLFALESDIAAYRTGKIGNFEKDCEG